MKQQGIWPIMPSSPCAGNAYGAMPRTLQPEPVAGMAELVDALDSKSSSGNRVGVRFPLPAPNSRMKGPTRGPFSFGFPSTHGYCVVGSYNGIELLRLLENRRAEDQGGKEKA